MEWYKTLDINRRINLKELAKDIGGIPYDMLIKLFGFNHTIEMLHNKLKLEGFDV